MALALALALAEAERLATSLSLSCHATPRHACVQKPGKRLDELEMDGSGDEIRLAEMRIKTGLEMGMGWGRD